jgi:hypothetical protein
MDDPPVASQPFQYSIPTETDHPSPATPPFQYSIPADTFDPIQEGIGLGAKAALVLAGLYGIVVTLLISVTEWNRIPPGNLRDMGVVMAGGMSLVIGGVPAVVVGAIGGGLNGWTFRFSKTRMSTALAIYYGFWISLLLLVVRIGMVAVWGGLATLSDNLDDQMMWLMWFAPNLIAFFGFWWVAYKLNEKMPT